MSNIIKSEADIVEQSYVNFLASLSFLINTTWSRCQGHSSSVLPGDMKV